MDVFFSVLPCFPITKNLCETWKKVVHRVCLCCLTTKECNFGVAEYVECCHTVTWVLTKSRVDAMQVESFLILKLKIGGKNQWTFCSDLFPFWEGPKAYLIGAPDNTLFSLWENKKDRLEDERL